MTYQSRRKETTAPYTTLENHKTCVLEDCKEERKEEQEGAKSWNEEFSNMKTPQPPTESFTSTNNWQYEQTASCKPPSLVQGEKLCLR